MGDGDDPKATDSSVTNDPDVAPDEGPAQFDGSGKWFDSGIEDSVPFYSQGDNIWKDLESIGKGDVESGLTDAAFQITDLAGNIGTLLLDPVGFFVGMGIGVIIDFIQPLEDAIGLVTGNPERMDGEIAKWGRVRTAMSPLAAEVRKTASDSLTSWQGDAAEVAKRRLNQLADAIDNVNQQMAYLEAILGLSKGVASALFDLVKSEVSGWVTQSIIDFFVADALAVETFGASVVAFVEETLVRFGFTSVRIVNFIMKATRIFVKVLEICMKVSKVLEQNAKLFAFAKNILPAVASADDKTSGSADNPMSNDEVSEAMR